MDRRFVALAIFSALIRTSASRGACTLAKLVEVPVTMQGASPQTMARINGHDASFTVDSGAFYSVISPGTAAENKLRLKPSLPGFYMQGVGGSASISLATVKTFTLAGLDIRNVQFLVGGSEVGGAGVIGQNVLHLADVEYDLPHGAVRLFRPNGCGGAILAYWAQPDLLSEVPLEESGSRLAHTKAAIMVNGEKIVAMFDTGAQDSVVSMTVATRLGFRRGGAGVQRSGMSRGFGNRMVPSWIAPFASVKIGGEELRNVELHVEELDYGLDMLVGADFFLTHRVYVANSQRKLYFTYTGGTFFNVTKKIARVVDAQGRPLDLKDTMVEPADAESLSRRGMALGARGENDLALKDLDRAIELAPAEPRYLLQRAAIERMLKQPSRVAADLDKALELKPDYSDALVARAEFRVKETEPARARSDAEAASRLLDNAADLRFDLSVIFFMIDRFEAGIRELDLWIAAHPNDSRKGIALNSRCWGRALLGRDLAKALADCNTAMRTILNKAEVLDSRGMVNLRLGNLAASLKDYDAALALAPNTAWSLYGRGIAKLKLGDKAGGEKDLAAAYASDRQIAEDAKRYGITS